MEYKIFNPNNTEKTVKVFISLPMKDRTDAQIKNDIEKITKYIWHIPYFKHTNIEIVHNFNEKPSNTKSSRLDNLGEAIKKLGQCDYCYFHPDWHLANGCVIEHDICELYNIDWYDLTREEFDEC